MSNSKDFCVLKYRDTVRKVIESCALCKRFNSIPKPIIEVHLKFLSLKIVYESSSIRGCRQRLCGSFKFSRNSESLASYFYQRYLQSYTFRNSYIFTDYKFCKLLEDLYWEEADLRTYLNSRCIKFHPMGLL